MASAYENEQIKRLDYVTLGKGGWTEEAVERERNARQDKLATIAAKTQVDEYPSYQSVAIVVDELPPQEIMDLFNERMNEYLARKNVTVLGSAIETETTTQNVIRRPMR